jgi:hypothetical protein
MSPPDPSAAASPSQRADLFTYVGYAIDATTGEVRCTYGTGGHTFTETFGFGTGRNWSDPAVDAAARLLFLVTGASYYKTTAARQIELGDTDFPEGTREFLGPFLINGLAEFALRNDLDLHSLAVGGRLHATDPVTYTPTGARPLIPFGGGIDSIVTVETLRAVAPDATLCVVHPPGQRFAAIEDSAAVTSLPVTYVTRALDPQVRRSTELGFFNGHVPVTAIITAATLVAAVLGGHDAVILSNEWSASAPTLVHDGRPINHQWSKSDAFEEQFSALVASALGRRIDVFSYLRNRSELWVAQQFAALPAYRHVFRSCNRAFHQDPQQRLNHWCGTCDKCCFIDLILSPFMDATTLASVFDDGEPLRNPALQDQFETLLAIGTRARPFECVGDPGECRAALTLAAARPDRRGDALIQTLRAALDTAMPDTPAPDPAMLLAPLGSHRIPDRYAPPDLLARTR